MDLSIVIPAFEEGSKVIRDITAAAEFLVAQQLRGEIIVVDDGSHDNTSESARSATISKQANLHVIRYEPHRGKGYAVRTGMKLTKGKYTMFADCGLCIPYGNVLLGLDLLRNNECELAHGSRRMIESDILRDQPWHRRLTSRFFKLIIRRLLRVPRKLTDTQCGFKIYKGDIARQLYGQCFTDGFLFDIEMILRAQSKGYRIKEFPVEWACDLDSRLSMTRTPWPVIAEIRRLRRKLSDGHPTSPTNE